MFGVRKIYSALLIFTICNWTLISAVDDKKTHGRSLEYLESVPLEEWKFNLDFGIEHVNRQRRLEENLVNARVIVQDGSISHMQLLDALPNEEARKDNDIARKLLAASRFVLNSKCLPHNIDSEDCKNFLEMKTLPANSELLNECLKAVESRGNVHNSFRRLLPRHYRDGNYEMFPDNQLTSPLLVSTNLKRAILNKNQKDLEDGEKNLAVAQWAQFVEHDLSKPVVTSMRDGSHIECCDKNNFELAPRHRHPSCAPLKIASGESIYDKVNCLNYVRSAIVSTKCTFGAIEQLNQATSVLDLSQLYGFTQEAQRRMRLLHKGLIKSSTNDSSAASYTDQLPMTVGNSRNYCAFENYSNQNSQCFMAGDSRVNNSPLTISLYTIFMRNHNQIAKKLASSHPLWSDEVIFMTAKAINIEIYRNIVFDEWLPSVIGADTVTKIKQRSHSKDHENDERVSNEFAIAAMRFYISMMPSVLHNFTGAKRLEYTTSDFLLNKNSNILDSKNIISLIDQTYKPHLGYTPEKIDSILASLLNQPAMKLDTIYEDSLIFDDISASRPTHSDFLAYDIQRGRDHGLKGYIKYLELHTDQKISSWTDLERFIAIEDLGKLKSIYNDFNNIDLLVGGMAEISLFGSVFGPTFQHIVGEQFSRIYQNPQRLNDQTLSDFKTVTAVDFLCANSELQQVPRNIFLMVSDKNPLLSCSDHLKLLRA